MWHPRVRAASFPVVRGNIQFSAASADAALDAALDVLDGGYLEFYDGEQPASIDQPVTTQRLLGACELSSPAFQPSSGGRKVANAIRSGTARATGLATWARACKADGSTVVLHGSVGVNDPTDPPAFVIDYPSIREGGALTMRGWAASFPL